MLKYIKYFGTLNLTILANHLTGNPIASDDINTARAFHHLYRWRKLNEGFEEAKITRRPICILFHKSWCPSCQQLKTKITRSVRLIDLSSQFVMINVEVGKDAVEDVGKYQPDGKYVPRILFFTPDGDFIKEAYNRNLKADEEHKYFYNTPAHILDTMFFVLKQYSTDRLPVTLRDVHFARKRSI